MASPNDRIPMQDVIPPGDRSIRNIPVPSPRRRPSAGSMLRQEEEERVSRSARGPRSPRTRLTMWGGAIVAVAALLFFGFSILFAGATVSVTPKSAVAALDGSFTASPSAPITGLSYQVISVDRSESEVVSASGEADVERRAQGVVTVQNDYSKSPQRLIKNTRFEAPDGKIYRINESVDVPGQRTEDGKTVPGTIDVTIYADSPGEAYNRGLTDFTIPGFKGDPRYARFSAHSKTPMTGGFVGRERVVSDAELAAARGRIHEKLSQELKDAARAQMPAGFVFFDDAGFISFESAPTTPQGEGEAAITEKGTLQGIIFNNRELAAFIARNAIASYGEEPVFLPDTAGIAFAIPGKDALSLPLERPLPFTLKGSVRVVWYMDPVDLQGALLGREKAALPTIMGEHPVASFSVSSRPFWSSRLPDDPNRLNVVLKVPDGAR